MNLESPKCDEILSRGVRRLCRASARRAPLNGHAPLKSDIKRGAP